MQGSLFNGNRFAKTHRYARFEARIPLNKRSKSFVLELDFNLVLAIDGLHLNGRVKHIL